MQESTSPTSATIAHITNGHAAPRQSSTIYSYLSQAAGVAFFRAPRWDRLPEVRPGFVLAICLGSVVLECISSFAVIEGSKRFYPEAIAVAGWLGLVALLWACWASLHHEAAEIPVSVRRADDGITQAPKEANEATDDNIAHVPKTKVSSLFALSVVMGCIIFLITSAIYIPLVRFEVFDDFDYGNYAQWALWGLGLVWGLVAQIVLLARASPASTISSAAILLLLSAAGIHIWAQPATFWYADNSKESSEDHQSKWDQSHLKPEKLLRQAGIIDAALAALPAQRPGVVDTYVITFSPYASEDVFLKESEVVSRVMSERFGTEARTIRLVNHASTVDTLAWATPENLKKTLDHIGKIIDPAEDMVFIHFTSHGGSDGKLAVDFWPLQIDALTGAAVRTMLDEANIPVRVLSISACFSGSWIEPLRTQGTLVMTASDADHTSYGCGKKSDLTYFTRAVFDEQLGKETRSFEDAFNAARPIIETREKKAGKKDGFSNPQIFVGDVARKRIDRWTQEIVATDPTKKP